MISKLLLFRILFLFIALFVFVTGCTHQPVQITPISVLLKPTLPFTPTIKSPEPTPTWIQLPIPSSTPSPTITFTIVPSLTHLPAKQAEEAVSDLLLNNAGCRLPCWWGVQPGKTTWEAAQKILLPIASDFIFIEPSGDFTKVPKGNSFTASIQFPALEDLFAYYPSYNYSVDNGLITTIWTEFAGNASTYILPNFLKEYGQPDEVWIRTYQNKYEGVLPFEIVLFYPKQGIVASYSPEARRIGNKVQACLQQTAKPTLALWSPSERMDFEDVEMADERFHLGVDGWPLRNIKEATGMDEKQFFETFKNPDNTKCLETLANLWFPLP